MPVDGAVSNASTAELQYCQRPLPLALVSRAESVSSAVGSLNFSKRSET